MTTAGGIASSIVTAPLTLADHRASDSERTQALVTTALVLATGGLARAAKPALTYVARGVAARVPAASAVATSLGSVATRVGQVARIDLGEAAAAGGRFVLRTGSKAVDALPANALGQSVRAANQRLLVPLVRQAENAAVSVGRTADWAKDYFSLANNFGRGPVMNTGARVLQKTGLAEVQGRHAAEKAYAAIRSSTDDVARIAKVTGRTEAEIAQIKKHLFHERHNLGSGVVRRLDADPQIASAWGRLKAGSRTARDLALLEHELAESMLVKAGMSQKAAHAAVEKAVSLERTSAGGIADKIDGAGRARLGVSTSSNYRKTFFAAHPETRGKVWIHHAVERQVARDFPDLVSKSQIHSLENLRGIPKGINGETHLSQIRKMWNRFYKTHPNPTLDQLLDQATKIDNHLGHLFDPPIR
jgi:hypothetical protein